MTHSFPTRRSSDRGGNFAEVSLPGAAKDTIAREMLNRPIRINCRVPAPVVWKWQVVGVDRDAVTGNLRPTNRSEEHTSELQSLMRNSYAVFCLKKKKTQYINYYNHKIHDIN